MGKSDERWYVKNIVNFSYLSLKDRPFLFKEVLVKNKCSTLIVDIPLSGPTCHSCTLNCPGVLECLDPSVGEAKREIEDYLNKNISKSLKKKLKRGVNPFWNRNIDVLVWTLFYDIEKELFNSCFDSFSSNTIHSFFFFNSYLKRFLSDIEIYESTNKFLLGTLYYRDVLNKKDIRNLSSFEEHLVSKKKILQKIEEHFEIFIYENDFDYIVEEGMAFNSFSLALMGIYFNEGRTLAIPSWCNHDNYLMMEL